MANLRFVVVSVFGLVAACSALSVDTEPDGAGGGDAGPPGPGADGGAVDDATGGDDADRGEVPDVGVEDVVDAGSGPLTADYLGVLFAGQSTSVGGASVPSGTPQPFHNVKVGDAVVASASDGWIWSANGARVAGAHAFPTVKNGFEYVASAAGKTGTTEPTWPTSAGASVVDGTVTWVAAATTEYPFDVTAPSAADLSFVPMVTPTRPVWAAGQRAAYPTNILGESQGVSACNQATASALLAGAPEPVYVIADVAIGGTSIAGIDRGGVTNAYAAALAEIGMAKAIAARASRSYAVAAIVLGNGEADAAADGTYESGVETYDEAHLQADVRALTGQTGTVPFLLTQQTSSPPWSQSPPFSAAAQLRLGGRAGYALACTSYQYPYAGGAPGQHMSAQGYELRGEKIGEALDAVVRRRVAWTAPVPLSITASAASTSVVVKFAVNAGMTPLRFATTDLLGAANPGPHSTGALHGVWGSAKGFEAQILRGVTIVGATNANPIVIETATPHGLATGALVHVVDVKGNTAANAQSAAVVIDATHFSINQVGNGVYAGGGTLLLPVVGATNASPIVVTTAAAHGLSTGDVVSIGGARGNTAANGHWVVTVLGPTTIALTGSKGNGAYLPGGSIVQDLGIASVAVQNGDEVALTLTAPPGPGLAISYAWTPDDVTVYAGGMSPGGRYGMLTDSDPFVGRSGAAQPSFAAIFQIRGLT